MLYVCVDSFVCFKIDPFLSELNNFLNLGDPSLRSFKVHQEIIRKKSLLSRIRKLQWGCFVVFSLFFFSILSKLFTKKSSEKWCLFISRLWICLVRGGKKTGRLPGWVPLFFTFKTDHMLQYPTGIFREVDSDKENANSQRHCRRCRNAAVLFSEDLLVLYRFYPFFCWELVQQQKTTWSWTWPIWNKWKRIHTINLVKEVVSWNRLYTAISLKRSQTIN